jgi:hypothetical protein
MVPKLSVIPKETCVGEDSGVDRQSPKLSHQTGEEDMEELLVSRIVL